MKIQEQLFILFSSYSNYRDWQSLLSQNCICCSDVSTFYKQRGDFFGTSTVWHSTQGQRENSSQVSGKAKMGCAQKSVQRAQGRGGEPAASPGTMLSWAGGGDRQGREKRGKGMCGLWGDVGGTGDRGKGMGLTHGKERHDKNGRRDIPYFEKKKGLKHFSQTIIGLWSVQNIHHLDPIIPLLGVCSKKKKKSKKIIKLFTKICVEEWLSLG